MRRSPPRSLPLYKHKALSGSRSFRLLEIELLSDKSSLISCLVSEYNVEDLPPSYAALPYVWGDANLLVPILLNHHRAEVTKNLYDALLEIQNTFLGLTIWIDALCIDQGNPHERNQQVALMRHIYSKASHTITWLGPHTGHVEHLFQFIEHHQAKCAESRQFLSGRAKPVSPPRSVSSQGSLRRLRSSRRLKSSDRLRSTRNLRSTHPPVAYKPSTASLCNDRERPPNSNRLQQQSCSLDSKLLGAVQDMEEQPYWDRVWIIQEVVVAQKVLLMCGSRKIDWGLFINFLRLLSNDHFAVPYPGLQYGTHRAFACSHKSFILRLSRWPQSVDLAQALDWSSTSQAKDVRDKVYALLGLVKCGEGTSLIANYSVSPCVVFCLALRAIVRDWHRLLSSHPTFDSDHITLYRRRSHTEVRHITSSCSDVAAYHLDTAQKESTRTHPFSRFYHCDGQACGSKEAMWIAAC